MRQKFITCGKNKRHCDDPHCMRPKDRQGNHLRVTTHKNKIGVKPRRKRRGND